MDCMSLKILLILLSLSLFVECSVIVQCTTNSTCIGDIPAFNVSDRVSIYTFRKGGVNITLTTGKTGVLGVGYIQNFPCGAGMGVQSNLIDGGALGRRTLSIKFDESVRLETIIVANLTGEMTVSYQASYGSQTRKLSSGSQLPINDNITNGAQVLMEPSNQGSQFSLTSFSFVVINDSIPANSSISISDTIPDSIQSDNSTTSILLGAVLGAVLGTLFLTAVIITLIFFILKRGRDKRRRLAESSREASCEDTPNQVSLRQEYLKDIQINEKLGGGQFGVVFRGIWQGTTPVALKKLRQDVCNDDFDRECQFLQSFAHRNIVQFLGIFSENSGIYMVTEFLKFGSLDTLLQNADPKIVNVNQLLHLAQDAAAGMNYLSHMGIIHRDLAARNLLVAPGSENSQYLVKVGDFGMARVLKAENQIYESSDKKVAVKWSSMEVLDHGKFSTQSDVWAFGVVLWEIFTYGKAPYPFFSNEETYNQVKRGYRMEKPENCPEKIYQLARSCWEEVPTDRPTFKLLYDELSEVIDMSEVIYMSEGVTGVKDVKSSVDTKSSFYEKTPKDVERKRKGR